MATGTLKRTRTKKPGHAEGRQRVHNLQFVGSMLNPAIPRQLGESVSSLQNSSDSTYTNKPLLALNGFESNVECKF